MGWDERKPCLKGHALQALLTAVKTWPPGIYDLHHVIDEAKAALHVAAANENPLLLEALAEM
jgi:hypothetical protein